MGDARTKENVALLAMLRAQAYRWFHAALGYEPCVDVVSWLGSAEALDALETALRHDGGSLDAWTCVKSALASARPDGPEADAALQRLKGAYTRLFVGPEALSVKPWESSWIGADESLFQASTLEVRRAYLAEGFLAEGYPHIADDQIAIELDFMAATASELVEAVEGDEAVEARRLIDVSRSFLRAHLVRWVPRYAQALSAERPQDDFYANAVHLVQRFLTLDEGMLAEAEDALRVCEGERADERKGRGAKGQPVREIRRAVRGGHRGAAGVQRVMEDV